MAGLTKTERIERSIRSDILNGRWEPGERLPSEEELLAEFEISHTTLRSAMHVLMVDGLVVRRHGSGTYVTESSKTGIIAILAKATQLSSSLGYWYRDLVEEAQRRIAAAGYRPVLCIGSGETPEEFLPSINLLDKPILKDTLGVLKLTSIGPLETKLSNAGVDYVAIELVAPTNKFSVVVDSAAVIDQAVNTFRNHGYEDFSLMYHDDSDEPLAEYDLRIYGMLKRLYRSAVNFREDRLVPVRWSVDYEHAYEAFKEWWSKPDRPNAIFFADDALFDVASRAILELGIEVPEQLAVITWANMGRKFCFPVQVERIGFDPAEAVSAAWGMLRKLVTGEAIDEPVVYVQPRIWKGESL